MASFKEAYEKTMGHEGGYVNDPTDAGGETYKGVSRKYNPTWLGWSIIDSHKNESNFPNNLSSDEELQKLVALFYKEQYWDINKLDRFNNQDIAEEMFDTGVNMGVRRAAKFLQQSLNYLNRNEFLYGNLAVDGFIGDKTINALDQIINDRDEDVLLTMLNVLQGQHYFNYMDDNPSQKKYARGWFRRVKI